MACKRSGVQIPSAPHLIMKSFLNETKELLLSQGLVALIAIIQVKVVATSLGPETYGVIGIYLGISAISFRMLSSRNSDLVLLNFNDTNQNFLKSSILFEILLGIVSFISVIIILIISSNFNFFEFSNIPNYLFLFVFSRIFLNIFEVFKGVYTYKGNMKIYSLVESVSNIIRFVSVITLIYLNPTIENFFYALSIHQFLVSLLIFLLLIQGNENKNERMDLISYFKLSKNNFYKIRTDQAIGLIPANLDIVIIGYFSDFYSAGIYRIAKKLVDPVNYIIVAFSPWMLNKINIDKNYSFKKLTISILFPVAVFLFTFYYIFGEFLIEFIAGLEFAESYTPMIILVVGYLSYFLTFWTRHYLFLNNLIFKHTIGRLINLFVFLLTSPFLILNYGFNGIACSIAISTVVQKIYEFSIFYKKRNS